MQTTDNGNRISGALSEVDQAKLDAASKAADSKPNTLANASLALTKSGYVAKAKPITVTLAIDGVIQETVELNAQNFSTGSVGYYGNAKISIVVDGRAVKHQMGINLTAIGSKEWPAMRQ